MTTQPAPQTPEPCECCTERPAGHGHFGLYCQPCSEQPLTGCSCGGPRLGECDGCGGRHTASYSHQGRWGQGAIYAVVCPTDGLTTYVTTEALS